MGVFVLNYYCRTGCASLEGSCSTATTLGETNAYEWGHVHRQHPWSIHIFDACKEGMCMNSIEMHCGDN